MYLFQFYTFHFYVTNFQIRLCLCVFVRGVCLDLFLNYPSTCLLLNNTLNGLGSDSDAPTAEFSIGVL